MIGLQSELFLSLHKTKMV